MYTSTAALPSPGPRGAPLRELHAVGLVLLSAAGFGALGVLAQLAYGAGVSVLGLLSGRFLIAATLLWLIVVARRHPLPMPRNLIVGAVLGAGYSSMALCFAASLRHIPAGLADLLLFAYPALVSVGVVVLGRERWNRRRALALAVASAGITLALVGAGTGVIDPLGVALALGSALFYAAYVMASASVLARTDPLVLAALVATGAALVFCIDAGISGQVAPRGGFKGIALVAAAALSSSVLGTSAFLAGVRRLGASRASIVSSAEPALTAIFAFAAFGQRLGRVQLLGACLVLASVPILELTVPLAPRLHERKKPGWPVSRSSRSRLTALAPVQRSTTATPTTHTDHAHPTSFATSWTRCAPAGQWPRTAASSARGRRGLPSIPPDSNPPTNPVTERQTDPCAPLASSS